MKILAQAIVNCFRKTGITPEAQNVVITDADDPFSNLKENIQQLHDIDPDRFQKVLLQKVSLMLIRRS